LILTEREKTVLKIIVEDYVRQAMPIASGSIVDKYGLGVSSATIRNDMACLEQEGYIIHPHTSAGSIPTDKAYRYYVESMSEDIELPPSEQDAIYQLFWEAKEEVEQWLKLAAALLAHLACNMVVVTSPKGTRQHFKHLDLVALQDFLVLFILVLYEAEVLQKVLPSKRAFTQDELTRLANKFNSTYAGMDSNEIIASKVKLSPEEKQISKCLAEMMAAEDKQICGKPHLEGLRLMLSHPEFSNNPKVPSILEVLESEEWLKIISSQALIRRGKIKIIIGKENPEALLQDLSLIVNDYGIPGTASGLLGVVGPKRMDYNKTISSLNYFTALLNNRIAQYF